MDQTYNYTVLFEPTDEGVVMARVPALPGCVTYGYSFQEAEANIQEAIACHIESMIEDGVDVPIERPDLLPIAKPIEIRLSA